MTIYYHPDQGTILICDFQGMVAPEMVKRRPVVVISPRRRRGGDLCTVVPLSTTDPSSVEPFHYRLSLDPPLPTPFDSPSHWVKADMLYTLRFDRFSLPFTKKTPQGKRMYDVRLLEKSIIEEIKRCISIALDLQALTRVGP